MTDVKPAAHLAILALLRECCTKKTAIEQQTAVDASNEVVETDDEMQALVDVYGPSWRGSDMHAMIHSAGERYGCSPFTMWRWNDYYTAEYAESGIDAVVTAKERVAICAAFLLHLSLIRHCLMRAPPSNPNTWMRWAVCVLPMFPHEDLDAGPICAALHVAHRYNIHLVNACMRRVQAQSASKVYNWLQLVCGCVVATLFRVKLPVTSPEQLSFKCSTMITLPAVQDAAYTRIRDIFLLRVWSTFAVSREVIEGVVLLAKYPRVKVYTL